MKLFTRMCLASALLAAAACPGACGAAEPAATAPGGEQALSPERSWRRELDYYLSLTEPPVSEPRRQEAASILSRFRKMVLGAGPALPAAVPGAGAVKGGPREQVDRLLVLLSRMKSPEAPRLAGPEAAGASAPKPAREPDAARAEALQLLEALSARLAPALTPEAGKKEAPAPKLPAFTPFRGVGSGGRCGVPVYSASGLPSPAKIFRMKGYFEGKFPAWPWSLTGKDRAAGGEGPHPEGALTPMGIYLGEPRVAPPAKVKKYKFAWKDRKGAPASQAVASQVLNRPDLRGYLGEETEREIIIDPELPGTPYMVRGVTFRTSTTLDCAEKCQEKWWSASVEATYWRTRDTCAGLVKWWTPPLPGERKTYTPLVPLESPGGYGAPEGGGSRALFEMRYQVSMYRCNLPVHPVRQKVQVLCVQAPRGLYTLTFDATEEIFPQVLPEFETVGRSFKPR